MSNKKNSSAAEILDKYSTKKSLPESYMKLFLKNGFMYGSYVYGGFDKEKSDIDIAVHPSLLDEFDELIQGDYGFYENVSYAENHEFKNLYVKHNGYLINLSFFYQEEPYLAYKKATETLKVIHSSKVLNERMVFKSFRVKLFEFLVHELKHNEPPKKQYYSEDMIPF